MGVIVVALRLHPRLGGAFADWRRRRRIPADPHQRKEVLRKRENRKAKDAEIETLRRTLSEFTPAVVETRKSTKLPKAKGGEEARPAA